MWKRGSLRVLSWHALVVKELSRRKKSPSTLASLVLRRVAIRWTFLSIQVDLCIQAGVECPLPLQVAQDI